MVEEVRNVLNGVPLVALPEGWTATGAAAIIKCTTANGEETWCFRTSMHLGDEEVLGALVIRTAIAKQALLDAYTMLPEDDED